MSEPPAPDPKGRRSGNGPPAAHTRVGEGGSRPPRRCVLIASNERHIVRLMEVNLQRAGYQVMTAHDGREALEKSRSEKPDLVVLDSTLQHLDGFEVLKNLKADPCTAQISVIMLTAKAQDADVISGWQSGVNCYLTKPFGLQELLEFLKRFFH